MLYEPTRQWMKDYLRVRLASGAFAAAGFGLSLAVGFSLFTESDINRSLGFEGVIFAILGAACVFLFDLVFRSHAFAAIVVPDGIYSKGQSQISQSTSVSHGSCQ
jgi:membrane associated rhomboid family serine protease